MEFRIEDAFEKYKNRVFAVGFSHFKNSTDADDIVQETFYRLYRRGSEFESEEHLRNWLMRVAVNECRRVAVSGWLRRRESIEDYAEKLAFEEPQESEVFLAVMSLPRKYRTVIHLDYYEGYSAAEIGELMDLSTTAVTTRLLRGRKQLKEKLLEVWKDE